MNMNQQSLYMENTANKKIATVNSGILRLEGYELNSESEI